MACTLMRKSQTSLNSPALNSWIMKNSVDFFLPLYWCLSALSKWFMEWQDQSIWKDKELGLQQNIPMEGKSEKFYVFC